MMSYCEHCKMWKIGMTDTAGFVCYTCLQRTGVKP
jgi:hypothetical protein